MARLLVKMAPERKDAFKASAGGAFKKVSVFVLNISFFCVLQ